MCGLLYQALEKCQQCPGRKGGKGKAGGKADTADQGKKGYGYQQGKYGNQWQVDLTKNGKPNKGKGKVVPYQWQQQNPPNEWFEGQETKNGGNRLGWQPNATHHDNSKASRPNRSRELHRLTKEKQVEALTQMHL